MKILNGNRGKAPTQTAGYIYNGQGQRVAKTVNGAAAKYYYDGDELILEKSGATVLYYSHGPRIDEIISDSRGYCYHTDGLGSIVNLTDLTGSKANSYTYTAFGKMRSQSGTVSNAWLFTGRQYDSESGLYYLRNRYYDPKTGRFITRDPIGIDGGINFYQYCGNNPVNRIDPWGWAYIGSRPLDAELPGNGWGSLRHDQIWYHDGTGNSGFFNDDKIREDREHSLSEYDFNRDTKYYDDALMHQAEKNVQHNWDMDWRMDWKVWDWNNCQDYSDAVREEYKRLEKEQSNKCNY